MNQHATDNSRDGYDKLFALLQQYFTVEGKSGTATVHFKEGVPMTVEPSPRISLK